MAKGTSARSAPYHLNERMEFSLLDLKYSCCKIRNHLFGTCSLDYLALNGFSMSLRSLLVFTKLSLKLPVCFNQVATAPSPTKDGSLLLPLPLNKESFRGQHGGDSWDYVEWIPSRWLACFHITILVYRIFFFYLELFLYSQCYRQAVPITYLPVSSWVCFSRKLSRHVTGRENSQKSIYDMTRVSERQFFLKCEWRSFVICRLSMSSAERKDTRASLLLK